MLVDRRYDLVHKAADVEPDVAVTLRLDRIVQRQEAGASPSRDVPAV